jgi:2-polyprenyl-3-methyl-5-hydroxy-6-metoxy-1,4-benzoquinol methylase
MIPDRRETYTVGYTDVAVRYMKRRHAGRDAAFFMPALKPGMRLLDCGCGPGSITVGLAVAVAPGEVIGMDLEAGQIELARAQARESGLQHVRFEVASVYELPFTDRSFDAVFSHALFEHLAEPEAALQEIRRVLRPGGLVGLSSPDWSGNLMVPADPEVGRAVEIFKSIQLRNGGNPYVGRELGRLLKEAGFSAIRLSAVYDCYEDVPLVAELLAQQIELGVGKQIVASPGLDRSEVGALCHALRTWAKQDGVLFAQTFVDAIGCADQ